MTKKNQDAWLYEGGRITRRQLLALAAATGMSVMYNGKALAQQPAAATAPPAAPKGQVVVGLSQESTVFNPLLSSIEVDHGVWWNLYDPLWNCDETGQLHPKLATEIPSVENGGVSEDGLNWRIRLRDDVVWHDGTPFTAEDVKFTLELINNPDFNSRTRQGHELVKNIQVVGPHELTWEMDRLYAPYWSQLSSTFMVPAHILGKADDPNTAPFNQQPVGTGPFKWGSRTSGDRLVLEANTDYFGDGPYIERLVFKYIPDMNALYTQFRTGQVDMVGINGILNNFYEEASQLPDLVIDVNQTASIESITPNHEHPALKHKEVRQALYQGINKQAIIDLIYYGLPAPTESFLPNESWAYNADLPKQVYDLDAANAILDEAGWVRGSGGIREKDGVKLAFDLSTTSGSELRAQTQQLIQQDWLKLGVDMKINNMPAAVMWGDFWFKSEFESTLVAVNFMTGSDPDVSYRFNSQATPRKGGSGSNVSQYADPKVDELLLKGQTTINHDERKAVYLELQELLREDLHILPLYQMARIEGYKKGLMGYKNNVNVLSNSWNAGTWYWAS